MNDRVPLTREEVLRTAGLDTEFFCRHFFPRTFRQPSPGFHRTVDSILDDPHKRLVDLKMFRGSAKTTKFRSTVAKRVSYGLSNTVVYVSNAQHHAAQSLRWLSKQLRFNDSWSSFYRLRKGDIWREGEQIEIINETLDTRTSVLALGLTGQIRGINIDDFRPDFIVADDIDNEETTATEDQRKKTAELMLSLEKALAPASESPWAKMALGQTPISMFDYISTVSADPGWHHAAFSCFDAEGHSTWASRYPTPVLLADKERHIRLNKLSVWLREMECKVVSSERSPFKSEWLRFYEGDAPAGGMTILAIDPASSDAKTADDQAIVAVRIIGQDVYVLDYTAERGEMPEAAAMTFFRFLRTYGARKGVVEKVSYQRVLKWYLEKRMQELGIYVFIDGVQDSRKKSDRIIQALGGRAAYGHIYCRPSHHKFIQQFTDYAPDTELHDDLLDAVAMAITGAGGAVTIEGDYVRLEAEREYAPLEDWRACP